MQLPALSPNLLDTLPEDVLTVTGVVVMLLEPVLAPGKSRKPLGWLAILGTVLAGLAAWLQLQYVNANGPILAFSGSLQVDAYSVFFHLLIAAVVVVVLLASLDYFQGPVSHAGEYFALVCFGAAGMMFMTSAVELLMVFIGLEISSISTYILAGFRKGQATASESSLKYFLLGSFATAFLLYGIALLFGATGTTTIAGIAAGLPHTALPTLALAGVAMITIGIAFKVSAAPFHVWTPDVYQGAPAPVVALMSTAPKAAAFAVLLRVLFNATPGLNPSYVHAIETLAVLSMFVGNIGALVQNDVKRMLAYSSIAHAGYTLVAFCGSQSNAVSGVCFYVAAYAAMNIGALLVIAEIGGFGESARSFDDFTGLALRRPGLAALLAFFLLSLIGIPFTGGFFGKFYVFSGAVADHHALLAFIGLLNSGIACFYYLRLLAALYARPLTDSTPMLSMKRVAWPAGLALAATAAATLALGIAPGKLLHLTQRATPETLPTISSLR